MLAAQRNARKFKTHVSRSVGLLIDEVHYGKAIACMPWAWGWLIRWCPRGESHQQLTLVGDPLFPLAQVRGALDLLAGTARECVLYK